MVHFESSMRCLLILAAYARIQARKEQSLLPPGMCIMPEEERISTLERLQQLRADVEVELLVGAFLSHK